MNTPLETLQFPDGRTLSIIFDPDPIRIRDSDTPSTMVCFHHRYQLGDEADGIHGHGYKASDSTDWHDLESRIRSDHPNCVILPLYLYDHSGLAINTTGFSCPWDSGQVGFIFTTAEQTAREFADDRTLAEKNLRTEVELYNDYLCGNVYGFEVRDTDGIVVDSGWDFYDSNPLTNGMAVYLDDTLATALRNGDYKTL